MYLWPDGDLVLTALLSFARSRMPEDYDYSWVTQTMPEQQGTFTAGEIYTDVGLSSAYAGSGVAGNVLYVKTTAAIASQFRFGHQVLLRDASDLSVDVNGKCVGAVQNGANSYVAVRLLEDDDNSSSNDLQTADTIKVIGNINPQGGVTPSAITYYPTKYTNYTQIFRTPLEMARTHMKIRRRAGNSYADVKKMALYLHNMEKEHAFWWGIATENTGDNGQPETTTQGLIPFLRENLSSHVVDFATSADYSGKTWLQAGDDWLLDQFEVLTRYTDKEGGGGLNDYLIVAGSGARKQISRLAKYTGNMQIMPGQNIGFGFTVDKLVTDFGTFNIKTHPLWSVDATTRNCAAIIKPKNVTVARILGTQFWGANGKPYVQTSSGRRIDGVNEEYISEEGLEYHHPQNAMFLSGFGETAA